MATPVIPIWKQAPFIRVIVPLMAGITAQHFAAISASSIALLLIISPVLLITFSLLKLSTRFRYGWVNGMFIHLFVFSAGMYLVLRTDALMEAERIEAEFKSAPVIMAILSEPLSEKPSSWKGMARICAIEHDPFSVDPPVYVMLYFKKDSTPIVLEYGDRIVFNKIPRRITNGPGSNSFDYKKYAALRNIYFQVFLGEGDYTVIRDGPGNRPIHFLQDCRAWVIGVLQKYIASKKEYGFAEALLIGYRDDLEKSLLTSYGNTGVIHVVAISGLHLGLIYVLLKRVTVLLGHIRPGKWLRPFVIISGLWIFSLMAGGSPSVLRSAVMFTCIITGENIQRRTSLINNLGASAFILLCINPLWLWNIGFQLSYAALLGIAIFQKPLYHVFPFKNKLGDALWKMNAVTLSAMLLTVPLSTFYFHQFPNLFLVTNLIAVPLSSLVLISEITLCVCSACPLVAKPFGMIIASLIKIMNGSVEWMDSFRYSTITGIDIDLPQLIFIYLFIFSTSSWLILKQNKYVKISLLASILFMADQFI